MWHLVLVVVSLIYTSLIYLLLRYKESLYILLISQVKKENSLHHAHSFRKADPLFTPTPPHSQLLWLALSRVSVFCLCQGCCPLSLKQKKLLAGWTNQSSVEVVRRRYLAGEQRKRHSSLQCWREVNCITREKEERDLKCLLLLKYYY